MPYSLVLMHLQIILSCVKDTATVFLVTDAFGDIKRNVILRDQPCFQGYHCC